MILGSSAEVDHLTAHREMVGSDLAGLPSAAETVLTALQFFRNQRKA